MESFGRWEPINGEKMSRGLGRRGAGDGGGGNVVENFEQRMAAKKMERNFFGLLERKIIIFFTFGRKQKAQRVPPYRAHRPQYERVRPSGG